MCVCLVDYYLLTAASLIELNFQPSTKNVDSERNEKKKKKLEIIKERKKGAAEGLLGLRFYGI